MLKLVQSNPVQPVRAEAVPITASNGTMESLMLYFGSKPEEYSLKGCWWTDLCADPPTSSDILTDHKDMITLTHSYHDTATRIGQKPHECLLLSFI